MGFKIPAHSSCCSVVLVQESTEACGVPKLRTDTESEAIYRWNRILAPRTRNLPAHDGELVPEHDDLEFLELLGTEAQEQQLQDKAKREIHER